MIANKIINMKPEHVFLVLSFIIGLIFATFVPPFGVNDEAAHLFKAYDVSKGNIIPKSVDVNVPKNLESYHIKTNINELSINSNGNVFVDMSKQSIIIYPPLPYLATAMIMKIGEFFNFTTVIIMYIARIINLLIYMVIVYFAIKRTPILKYVFVLLALMPMTLFLASSASSDSLTIALSLLVISLFLDLSLNKNQIQKKDILIISISTIALSLTKPTYALISLLFFIIPYNNFKNAIDGVITGICAFLTPFFISFTWNNLFKHMYSYVDSGFNSCMQAYTYNMSFVSHSPFNFLDLIINTILYEGEYLISKFVVDFGNSTDHIPFFISYIYLILILVVSLYDVSDFKLNLRQKFVGISTFIIIFLAICVAELITWTPIGHNVISGIQGRYFIPTAPLLFLIFNNSFKAFSLEKNYKKILLCAVFIFYILLLAYIVLWL
ncbi:MAG: DUF2142 domain-containing protein [Methanobrevibacter sp. CfCl-M3]